MSAITGYSSIDESSPLLAGARQIDLSVKNEEYRNTSTLRGDKAIAEATVKMVVDILIKDMPYGSSPRRTLEDLKVTPLNAERAAAATVLFNELPNIQVVDDEDNHNPLCGGNMVVWERELDINDQHTIALIDSEGLTGLSSSEQTTIRFATITETAWKALVNYTKTLIDQERTPPPRISSYTPPSRQTYTPPRPTYTYRAPSRTYTPTRRSKKTGCCAIL